MAFLDYSQINYPINTRDPTEIRINCPYCQDESYHLYINLKKKVFHCFRCGIGGKTNVDIENVNNLYLNESNQGESFQPTLDIRLPKAIEGKFTMRAVKYLARRGILESDTTRHGIYCATTKSRYFGRIIIGSGIRGNACSYFVARAYTSIGFPKYLNPPGSKGRGFFSPKEPDKYQRQYWPINELMIVEGPFDYLKASRHGPTLALLGKELMPQIARQIVSDYTKVRVMLDKGLKEHWAAIKIQDMLKVHVDTEVLDCPRNDPGEMDEDDFEELFRG